MKPNIGRTDRMIRILAGLFIIALGQSLGKWWGLLGLLPIITASLRFCPLYTLVAYTTFKEGERGGT